MQSPSMDVNLWHPSLPRPSERQAFVGLHHGPVPLDRVHASEAYQLWYEPLGIQDHARVLLYDGDRFIAWVGLMREDAASFEPPDLAVLNRALPMIAGPLIAAENLRLGWQDVPLHLVFDAESFRVRLASPRASEWLSDHRRAAIVAYLRALRAGEAPPLGFVDGYAMVAAKLCGDDGPAFHVNVRLPDPIALSPAAALTPREREVAALAAAGATATEIAAELGNTPHTVRGHLKSIYHRLGISTRVELAALLRRDTPPPSRTP